MRKICSDNRDHLFRPSTAADSLQCSDSANRRRRLHHGYAAAASGADAIFTHNGLPSPAYILNHRPPKPLPNGMSCATQRAIVRWLYAQARTAASGPVALGPDKARASRRARPVNVYAAVRVTTGRLRQVSGSNTSDIGNPHDRESIRSTHARHTIRRVQHRTHVILMPQLRKILPCR
jgi:hypothetical protein